MNWLGLQRSTPRPLNAAALTASRSWLRLTFTPAAYTEILQQHMRNGVFYADRNAQDYWPQLPICLVSRCPLCTATYTARLDLHSLAGWHTSAERFTSVSSKWHQWIGCQHFVAVQSFVTLNGHVPHKFDYFDNALDVPFLMPTFVPDDIPSVAVVHSLPICEVERETFIPRYSAFMITYYADQPVVILDRRRAWLSTEGEGDSAYYGSILATAGEGWATQNAGNLPYWIRRGKLQWLDPLSADLALRQDEYEFPYANIQGYRRPALFRNGRITFEL